MIDAAIETFREFVASCVKGDRIVAVHDWDADGVTSAIVWQRTFERLDFTNLVRVIPGRIRDAWSDSNRAQVAAAHPDKLFLFDLGSRAEAIIENVPTCIVDHHRPDGIPPNGTLISAYDWTPIPNTSLLTYELCRSLTNIDDLNWVAAIGAISDLGERAPFALVAEAKKKYTAKALKEVTTLVNAARRASSFDPERAVRVLLAHNSPSSVLESDSDDLRALKAARAEVNEEMAKGKMSAPKFDGNVALIRVSSPCQIHPLIAQIWRSRLPEKYVVIVANDGYLPGRVNFSVRSKGASNALDLLRSVELPAGEGDYAHGHDHATGGSLPLDRWNALLNALGF